MRFFRLLRVLPECYYIGKWRGVLAWFKYLCGAQTLPDMALESSDFSLGGCDGSAASFPSFPLPGLPCLSMLHPSQCLPYD